MNPPLPAPRRAVQNWLWCCAALVFFMIVLGGVVRLTGSGLSMVDWRPILGAIPPLSEQDWLRAFAAYQQFPEFRLVHPDMSMAHFKFIFWMEYAHRVSGRVLGLVYLLPFLYFLLRNQIPKRFRKTLWLLFFLGGLQGLLGWYMVQSGLVDNPVVSPVRLLLHFMLAVIIYLGLLRTALRLRLPNAPDTRGIGDDPAGLERLLGSMALIITLLAMSSGALVAGSRAGRIFNHWPRMGDTWIPEQLFVMATWWQNLLENPITIQFTHRWLAVLVVLAASAFAVNFWHRNHKIARFILIIALCQFLLGIATLLTRVPILLGITHQIGALLLVSALAWGLFTLPASAPQTKTTPNIAGAAEDSDAVEPTEPEPIAAISPTPLFPETTVIPAKKAPTKRKKPRAAKTAAKPKPAVAKKSPAKRKNTVTRAAAQSAKTTQSSKSAKSKTRGKKTSRKP